MASGSDVGGALGTGAGAGIGAAFGGPMGAGIGASVGGPLGSLIGGFFGGGEQESAEKAALEQFLQAHPEVADPSAFNKLSIDPQTRAAQLQALKQLQAVYQSGGLDPVTRAQLAKVQDSNALAARAQEGRIANEMDQRGLSSSGANFAGQRAASQAATQGNYTAGIQAEALGREQQMAALAGAGGLAGQIRSADYGQAADKAAANDAISRFNAAQKNQFREWQGLGAAGAYGNLAGLYGQQSQQNKNALGGLIQTGGALANFYGQKPDKATGPYGGTPGTEVTI